VDWKRLSLGVAEGPFDFFTVDVSFRRRAQHA
jgi:hypothetical protein